jgi:hypothetical protein
MTQSSNDKPGDTRFQSFEFGSLDIASDFARLAEASKRRRVLRISDFHPLRRWQKKHGLMLQPYINSKSKKYLYAF